jgi:hypothetical protein
MLIALARAITRHENGAAPRHTPADWYPREIFDEAADLLMKG